MTNDPMQELQEMEFYLEEESGTFRLGRKPVSQVDDPIGDRHFLNKAVYSGNFGYETMAEMQSASRADMRQWDLILSRGGQKSFLYVLVAESPVRQVRFLDKVVVENGQPVWEKDEHGQVKKDRKGRPIAKREFIEWRLITVDYETRVSFRQVCPKSNVYKRLQRMAASTVTRPDGVKVPMTLGELRSKESGQYRYFPNPSKVELAILKEVEDYVEAGRLKDNEELRFTRKHLLDRHHTENMIQSRGLWGRTPFKFLDKTLAGLRRLQRERPDKWVQDPYGGLIDIPRHPTMRKLVRLGNIEEFGLWTLAEKLAARRLYNRRVALREEMVMRTECIRYYKTKFGRQPTYKEMDDWVEDNSQDWVESICQDFMRDTWKYLRQDTDVDGRPVVLSEDPDELHRQLRLTDETVADKLIALTNKYRVVYSLPVLDENGNWDWSEADARYLTVEELRDLVRDNASFRMQRSFRSQTNGWWLSLDTISRARGDEAGGRHGRRASWMLDWKYRQMRVYLFFRRWFGIGSPITDRLLGNMPFFRPEDERPSDQSTWLLLGQRIYDIQKGATELRGAFAFANNGVPLEFKEVLKTIPKLRAYARRVDTDPTHNPEDHPDFWMSPELILATLEPAFFRDPDMIKAWGGFFHSTVNWSLDSRLRGLKNHKDDAHGIHRDEDGLITNEETFADQQRILTEIFEYQKFDRLMLHILEEFNWHARNKTIHIRPKYTKLMDGLPKQVLEHPIFVEFIQKLNYKSDRRVRLWAMFVSHGRTGGVRALSSSTVSSWVGDGYGTDNGKSPEVQQELIDNLYTLAWLNSQYDSAIFLARALVINYKNWGYEKTYDKVMAKIESGLHPRIARLILIELSGIIPLGNFIPEDEPAALRAIEAIFTREEVVRLHKDNLDAVTQSRLIEELQEELPMLLAA